MSNFNFNMLQGENTAQYLWRCCYAKDTGIIDITWKELADILNSMLYEKDEYLDESVYRKKYSAAKHFYDEVFSKWDNDFSKIIEQKHELEKERVKVRDERNELRRILREQARNESLKEQVIRCIKEYTPKHLNSVMKEYINRNDSDLIIPVTDVHTGIGINNYWNKFDDSVLKNRLSSYLSKIYEIVKTHGSSNCYVILSELISGYIHPSLRIENNSDVIDQFLTITSLLSDFLITLDKWFDVVHVYVAPGNHCRTHANKDESLTHENFDNLVLPMLEAKLQNFNDIEFHNNNIESSIAIFNVRGSNVFAVHGDKDTPQSVVQNLTMMTGIKPDIVYMGHRHTNGMSTVYDTKIIQSGALSGSDQHCMDKRLKNNPEQMISVVNDFGIDCVYDIKFD